MPDNTNSLRRLSDSDLVDMLGDVKATAADIAAQERALKDEIKRRGWEVCDGVRYRATVSETERQTLDRAAVEEILGAERIAECLRASTSTTIRVSARVSSESPDMRSRRRA